MKKIYLMFASVLFLSGCAFNTTSTTIFHGENHSVRGSVFILASKNQENSLEFKKVSDYLTKHLVSKGYTKAINTNSPDYVATIQYGIDNGKITGAVLSDNVVRNLTSYTRLLYIDIYKVGNHAPLKVYEIRAKSVGACGNIFSVIYPMMDSVFQNFPGENGKPVIVYLPMDPTSC